MKKKKGSRPKSPIDGLIDKWASETINDYIRPVLPESIAIVDLAYDQSHCTPEIRLTLDKNGKPKMAELVLKINFSIVPKKSKFIQTRRGIHFSKRMDFSLPFPSLVGPRLVVDKTGHITLPAKVGSLPMKGAKAKRKK